MSHATDGSPNGSVNHDNPEIPSQVPDPLTSIYLALPRATPVLIAPAMNGKMWLHPANQRNVALLTVDGCSFIGPAEGDLACGYEGIGRLAPVEEILAALDRLN